MRLGIDVDGCLADFNSSFMDLIIGVTGRNLFPTRPFDIPTWDYPESYGYSNHEVSQVWNVIRQDKLFWASLEPLPSAQTFLTRCAMAADTHDLYFITSRPGLLAKQQTEAWLLANGGLDRPTVLVSSMKGWCARALRLDAYLDDKDTNAVDVRMANPSGYTFLLDQPWNRTDVLDQAPGIIRITSVLEFLERFGL